MKTLLTSLALVLLASTAYAQHPAGYGSALASGPPAMLSPYSHAPINNCQCDPRQGYQLWCNPLTAYRQTYHPAAYHGGLMGHGCGTSCMPVACGDACGGCGDSCCDVSMGCGCRRPHLLDKALARLKTLLERRPSDPDCRCGFRCGTSCGSDACGCGDCGCGGGLPMAPAMPAEMPHSEEHDAMSPHGSVPELPTLMTPEMDDFPPREAPADLQRDPFADDPPQPRSTSYNGRTMVRQAKWRQ